MEKISIIIPTYNRANILRKTLPSYLSREVLEVIVVNDGSTDDTEDILKQLAKEESKLKVFTKEHGGSPSARNYGIAQASSEAQYIFFGEDDAYLEEGTVASLLQCLKEYQADIVCGRVVPHKRNAKSFLFRRAKHPVILNLLTANFNISTATPIVVPFTYALFLAKKWVFTQVKFDESYFGNAYREDTDFTLNAGRCGAKIIYCPGSRLYHLEADRGGQRKMGWLTYEYAVFKNNWYFLNKNYRYLKNRYQIITPKSFLQVVLVLGRIYLLCYRLLFYRFW